LTADAEPEPTDASSVTWVDNSLAKLAADVLCKEDRWLTVLRKWRKYEEMSSSDQVVAVSSLVTHRHHSLVHDFTEDKL
jgi:hypothetical protein